MDDIVHRGGDPQAWASETGEMKMNTPIRPSGWLVLGFLGAVAGMAAAWWAGAQWSARPMQARLLQQVLHADSSSTGKSVSLASGRVMPEYEGLFMLDHKSGNLFCVLVNPRTGMEVGTFQCNVFVGLNLVNVADVDLVMTTGFVSLGEGGRVGNARPTTCICYVADGNSGRVVGYGFQFNPQAIERNVAQGGQMQVLWQGSLRGGAPVPAPAVPDPAAPAAGGGGNNAAGGLIP